MKKCKKSIIKLEKKLFENFVLKGIKRKRQTFFQDFFLFILEVLPDALKTDCVKCSPRQKDGAKIILRHMINKEPEWYEELEKKYDPTGIYKGKYEEELKEKKEAESKTKKN